jgi:hypothetical protein
MGAGSSLWEKKYVCSLVGKKEREAQEMRITKAIVVQDSVYVCVRWTIR